MNKENTIENMQVRPAFANEMLGEYPLANLSKDAFFKKVRAKRFVLNYHPVEYAYVVTIDFEKLIQVKANPPFIGYEDKYPEKSFVSFSSAHSAKMDAWDEIQKLLQGFA